MGEVAPGRDCPQILAQPLLVPGQLVLPRRRLLDPALTVGHRGRQRLQSGQDLAQLGRRCHALELELQGIGSRSVSAKRCTPGRSSTTASSSGAGLPGSARS